MQLKKPTIITRTIIKNLKFLALLILIALSIETYSQMGVTSYSVYASGINTSQNKMISGEFKTFANRKVEDLLMEVDGFYNFKAREYHRFSIGIGICLGPFRNSDKFTALTIPVSLEIFPIKEFKKISLLFELTPEILPEDGVNIRSLWGIRYTFGDKE